MNTILKVLGGCFFTFIFLMQQLMCFSVAYFSPSDKPQERLIELINKTKKQIDAAVYQLTSKHIADALIAAQKRGVIIHIVTDGGNITSQGSKIDMLQQAGIEIFSFSPAKFKSPYRPLMHNKFALFMGEPTDPVWLWTGSFNWTYSANNVNYENVIVTDDKNLIARYRSNFEELKRGCIRKGVAKGSSTKHQPQQVNPHVGLVERITDFFYSIRKYVANTRRRYF